MGKERVKFVTHCYFHGNCFTVDKTNSTITSPIAISMMTGKVLDCEVLPKYCRQCFLIGEKRNKHMMHLKYLKVSIFVTSTKLVHQPVWRLLEQSL